MSIDVDERSWAGIALPHLQRNCVEAMPRMSKKGPAARKGRRRGRKLGQADKLPGAAWTLWTHHILATGPTWLYPVVCLGHLLCLRVTEVLQLRVQDFDFEKKVVKVRALKKQAETEKFLGEAAFDFLLKLREEGVSVRRQRNTGVRGMQAVTDEWFWPEDPEHHLFQAKRRDSKLVRASKDTVARAIRRARRTFHVPHIPEVQPGKIRSHSGRHRCINDMKEHNVEREVGKKYARISDETVYDRYGKLSAQQAGKKLLQNHDLQAYWKRMYG